MITSLQQALGAAAPNTYTKVQATDLARQSVQTVILAYVQRTVLVQGVQLKDQIGGEALVMLGGLCSDGPLLVMLDQNANAFPPQRANYAAIGSANQTAL